MKAWFEKAWGEKDEWLGDRNRDGQNEKVDRNLWVIMECMRESDSASFVLVGECEWYMIDTSKPISINGQLGFTSSLTKRS